MVFRRRKINSLAGKYLKKAFNHVHIQFTLFLSDGMLHVACCMLHVAWTGTVTSTNTVWFYLWMPQYTYLAKEKDN
jgi:hypothetical protein